MASKEQNHGADSGAFHQKGGPFDYSPEADEETRRLDALKAHDRGEMSYPYVKELPQGGRYPYRKDYPYVKE